MEWGRAGIWFYNLLVSWSYNRRYSPSQAQARPRRAPNGRREERRRHTRVDAPNELYAPVRLLVDHLRVHAVHRRDVVHELALLLGHVRQDLDLLVRREETGQTAHVSIARQDTQEWTYSEKLFSTMVQNLALARANPTSSSL